MEALVMETVQWASLLDIDSIEPLNDDDAVVLEEIRQVLLRHKKLSRFGICLLHKHFEVAEDEVAIEYTDADRRVSTVVVEKKDALNVQGIQTVWRLAANGQSMGTMCVRRCGPGGSTHRIVHQRVPT